MGNVPAAGISSEPRVSVVVPAYKTASYIAESLDSGFAQTFRDFEVIVVNDGSPDTPELEDVLRPYMSRIQYIKQENRGSAGARNTGIRHSRGELVAFLESDDIWLPGYLEAQVKFLDQNPRVVASIADILRFGELAGGESVRKMRNNGAGNILNFEQMLRREGAQIPSATVVRSSRAKSCMYDEQLRCIDDIEFLYRVIFPDGLVGYLDQVLVKYRKHAASITGGLGDYEVLKNEVHFLRQVGKKLPLPASQRSLLNREIAALEAELAMIDAYQHLKNQEIDQAAACLRRANAFYGNTRIKLALAELKVFPHLTGRILAARLGRRINPPLAVKDRQQIPSLSPRAK